MKISPNDRITADCGTTLIEMLVVLAILGVMAAIAAPQMERYFERGQVNAAGMRISALSSGLHQFRADVGRYPTAKEGLIALLKPPAGVENWSGPYVRSPSSLVDPWGHLFGYRASGATFELYAVAIREEGKPGKSSGHAP